jgi:hypothetical protein
LFMISPARAMYQKLAKCTRNPESTNGWPEHQPKSYINASFSS